MEASDILDQLPPDQVLTSYREESATCANVKAEVEAPDPVGNFFKDGTADEPRSGKPPTNATGVQSSLPRKATRALQSDDLVLSLPGLLPDSGGTEQQAQAALAVLGRSQAALDATAAELATLGKQTIPCWAGGATTHCCCFGGEGARGKRAA